MLGVQICLRNVKFSLKVNILIREDDHDKLDIPEFEDIFAYLVYI